MYINGEKTSLQSGRFGKNYIDIIREKAKRNAELIQLLELHQQFESLIQYSQVSRVGILRIYDI